MYNKFRITTMMTISQFIKKQNAEKIAAEKAAKEQRVKEVSNAFKNIAMIFENSNVWEHINILPRMINLTVSDDAIKLFGESMKTLGKEFISCKDGFGSIYKNSVGKKTLTIECDYTAEELDEIFPSIVSELCDRADCEHEDIEKLVKDFN